MLARDKIQARATSGIRYLLIRQVFLQLFTTIGGVIIARTLEPSTFGVFAVVSAILGVFAWAGDVGLGPSLIQRRGEISEHDLQVAFTLQQALITVVVVAVFLCAPLAAHFYPQGHTDIVWLVRALAFTLYLTSWRAMSTLQLERNLKYQRLALIEVIEVVVYQCAVLVLALLGYGVWSFIWAVLLRGLLGAALVFAAAPWRVRLAFDPGVAWSLLRYGVPFQFQILTQALGNWFMPLIWAALLGAQGVGLISFASSNGRKPQVIIDNVMRVAFPHFSRIQTDRSEVLRVTMRYLTYLTLLAGLWASVLVSSGSALVLLVYSAKWLAAADALKWFACGLTIDVLGWVLSVIMNSTGKVVGSAMINLARAGFQIAISVVLVRAFGIAGAGISYTCSSVFAAMLYVRQAGPDAPRQLVGPLLWISAPIAIAMGSGLALSLIPMSMAPKTAATVCIVAAVYAAVSWLCAPAWLKQAVQLTLTRRKPSVSPVA